MDSDFTIKSLEQLRYHSMFGSKSIVSNNLLFILNSVFVS
jgi:hypothetical protein